MKTVKVVIGANYGDEGKGMMTRHFVLDAKQKGEKSIVVFHNGTAQRGHTVDYNQWFRHVYHHFGSGTGDGAPTFFSETFLVHPMEYHREWCELSNSNITPKAVCDPRAKVITPYDMLVDRATEEWIAIQRGEREFGSCGYGSWCAAEDRIPMGRTAFTVGDFIAALENKSFTFLMEEVWRDCFSILVQRGVDLEKTTYSKFSKDAIVYNFAKDFQFFIEHTTIMPFDEVWNNSTFDTFVFENGQGLGLDVDVDNDWHTTSHTGIYNPVQILGDRKDFNAEICYVSRSYVTRHGFGPLEDEVKKKDICPTMHDITNVPNEFQGTLRYSGLDLDSQYGRIDKDFAKVANDSRFKKSITITHLNEAPNAKAANADYVSDNPYKIEENK